MCAENRPSWGAVLANWRDYDASFGTKLRLTLSNTWTKIRTRSDCCGHYGQPGC